MNLDRPGHKYPDGVFVFDEPVLVECHRDGTTHRVHAEGYRSNCVCGPCVYINPWPFANDGGYAIKNRVLHEC